MSPCRLVNGAMSTRLLPASIGLRSKPTQSGIRYRGLRLGRSSMQCQRYAATGSVENVTVKTKVKGTFMSEEEASALVTDILSGNSTLASDADKYHNIEANGALESKTARVYTWEEEWDTIRDQIAQNSVLRSMNSIQMKDREEFARFLKSPSFVGIALLGVMGRAIYSAAAIKSSEIPIEEKETEKQETTAAVEKEIEEKKPGCDFNIYVISEESSHTGEARQQMTGDRVELDEGQLTHQLEQEAESSNLNGQMNNSQVSHDAQHDNSATATSELKPSSAVAAEPSLLLHSHDQPSSPTEETHRAAKAQEGSADESWTDSHQKQDLSTASPAVQHTATESKTGIKKVFAVIVGVALLPFSLFSRASKGIVPSVFKVLFTCSATIIALLVVMRFAPSQLSALLFI